MKRPELVVLAMGVVALALPLFLRLEEPPPPAPATPAAAAPPLEEAVPVAAAKTEDAPAEDGAPGEGVAPQEPDLPPPPIRVRTGVPGATVTLEFRMRGAAPVPAARTLTADGDGDVEFPVPVPERDVEEVISTATAPGYAPDRVRFGGGVPSELTHAMLEGEPVRGRVVGEDGAAIEGARVWGGLYAADTGPDGSFEVHWGEPEVRLQVEHTAHLSAQSRAPVPSSGVEVVLARGLAVRGRVTFPDGTPYPGARIQAETAAAFGARTREAVSGADGTYAVSGLAAGIAKVRCIPAHEHRDVEAGKEGVDFVVPHAVVQVRIRDEAGRPFGECRVVHTFQDGQGVSGGSADCADGLEEIEVRAGARLRLTVSAPGWKDATLDATIEGPPGIRVFDLVMRRATPIPSKPVRAR